MLTSPASTSSGTPLPIPKVQRAFDFERSTNEHIRELLHYYGLRTSLIRIKVIDALLVAAREGRAVGGRGVHGYLQAFVSGIQFISVREVLKRLCEEGVIVFQPDKSYRFTGEAYAMLEQHADR
ncbi:fe2+ zn2+ uptake regulation protein [Pseudomonas fluorescens]|jgi:Fe2+ or Zn2+ uptake regulation protein|uniref:fe2+ zn2+ uptake regulation protein n=1 Tax=Pseudomonas fluorescens TaxID=294 RepID=UPI001396EFCA|nr:fe2+ zn2+ uptake regulation protein [Pseudomonas fluorescens]QIA03079.1 fe2+ zn2+ uptake regulation protein [Pseudomonas fluorescens]